MKRILLILSLFLLVGCVKQQVEKPVEPTQDTVVENTTTVENKVTENTVVENAVVTNTQLTDEEIKKIVFEHAKVNEADVNHIIIEHEFEDDRKEIEVDFWIGTTEYSYTLDTDGNILEFEVEKAD